MKSRRDLLGQREQPVSVAVPHRPQLARFIQAGVIPTSTNAVLCEAHRTWHRPEAAALSRLYGLVSPNYAAVAESHQKAQEAMRH